MSVKMATDLTKPLDFIASGVFSEKGPAFRKFFPMTPPPLLCLGVKCVLVCERSPIPPPPLCLDIGVFIYEGNLDVHVSIAVTHSSSWFGIACVFVNGGNHLPLLLPWHLRTCTSKNQKEGGGTEEE